MAYLSFDATTVDPMDSFDPIPVGTYPGLLVDSQMKPNSSGQGEHLSLKLEIIEGPHRGRILWDNLNLEHPNPKAVEISHKRLSALCHAVNVLQPKGSEQLHGIPMMIRVGYNPGNGSYGPSNEVKGYEKYSSIPEIPVEHEAPWNAQAQGAMHAPTWQ